MTDVSLLSRDATDDGVEETSPSSPGNSSPVCSPTCNGVYPTSLLRAFVPVGTLDATQHPGVLGLVSDYRSTDPRSWSYRGYPTGCRSLYDCGGVSPGVVSTPDSNKRTRTRASGSQRVRELTETLNRSSGTPEEIFVHSNKELGKLLSNVFTTGQGEL